MIEYAVECTVEDMVEYMVEYTVEYTVECGGVYDKMYECMTRSPIIDHILHITISLMTRQQRSARGQTVTMHDSLSSRRQTAEHNWSSC